MPPAALTSSLTNVSKQVNKQAFNPSHVLSAKRPRTRPPFADGALTIFRDVEHRGLSAGAAGLRRHKVPLVVGFFDCRT